MGKTINFKEFKFFTNYKRTASKIVDIREEIADVIFVTATRIAGHLLAEKIYNSQGVIKLTDEEWQMLNSICGDKLTMAFMESLDHNVIETE